MARVPYRVYDENQGPAKWRHSYCTYWPRVQELRCPLLLLVWLFFSRMPHFVFSCMPHIWSFVMVDRDVVETLYMTALVSFFSSGSLVQIVLSLIVSVLACIQQAQYRPFKHQWVNWLQQTSLLVIWATLQSGLLLQVYMLYGWGGHTSITEHISEHDHWSLFYFSVCICSIVVLWVTTRK